MYPRTRPKTSLPPQHTHNHLYSYFHSSIRDDPTSSGCDELGIPHHPVSFRIGEEEGLQECVITQAQRLYGRMVGTVMAAAPRAVTLGERSIWGLLLVCSSPFFDDPSADLFNVLKSPPQSGCIVHLSIQARSRGGRFHHHGMSPMEPTRYLLWTPRLLLQKTELFAPARAQVRALPSRIHRHGVYVTTKPRTTRGSMPSRNSFRGLAE